MSVESSEGEGRDVIGNMHGTAGTARRVIFAAFISLAAAAASLSLATPIRAEGGVPIPAPAGTTWSIVAGYNTSTHSVSDDNDPHAIDLVRVPREETAFTSVLAPVNGTVAWRDGDGLSITDAAGFDHLLAHVEPLEHIQRGSRVAVGDPVAFVCAAYQCGNNGLPHIHYAIHRSRGDGYLGPSVPFTGEYAIEGRELYWRDEYNLHSGLEFTSTNTPNWTAPSVTRSEPSEPDSDDQSIVAEPQSVWTMPDDAPVGGWRAVGVHRDTSAAGLFADLDAPLSELVLHDSGRNTYHRFDPSDPGTADVAVRSLSAGEAVWALVDPYVPWLPAPPADPRQVTIRLRTGANLISWQGPDRAVGEALRNVAHFSRAYRYDPYADAWQFWSPDAPDFLNTLTELKSGDALYVVVRVGSIWTQLP